MFCYFSYKREHLLDHNPDCVPERDPNNFASFNRGIRHTVIVTLGQNNQYVTISSLKQIVSTLCTV